MNDNAFNIFLADIDEPINNLVGKKNCTHLVV